MGNSLTWGLTVFLAGQTVVVNAVNIIKWSMQKTTGAFARYSPYYEPATGVFSVPYFATKLRIHAVAAFVAGPSVIGRANIKRNGAMVASQYISSSRYAVDLTYDEADVPAGVQFAVEFVNPVDSVLVSFGSVGADYLSIEMATK